MPLESEKLVSSWLEAKGWEVISKNFRVRGSEIDIIAKNKSSIIFVEVKERKTVSLSDQQGMASLLPRKKMMALRRGVYEFMDRMSDKISFSHFNIQSALAIVTQKKNFWFLLYQCF